jgi:hypothetical protein
MHLKRNLLPKIDCSSLMQILEGNWILIEVIKYQATCTGSSLQGGAPIQAEPGLFPLRAIVTLNE